MKFNLLSVLLLSTILISSCATYSREDAAGVSGLKWSIYVVNDIDYAIANSGKDPVTSSLLYKSILSHDLLGDEFSILTQNQWGQPLGGISPPSYSASFAWGDAHRVTNTYHNYVLSRISKVSDKQQVWLENNFDDLKPKALEMLKQDYDVALQNNDLREIMIITKVQEKLLGNIIESSLDESCTDEEGIISTSGQNYIWQIESVEATELSAEYREIAGDTNKSELVLNPAENETLISVDVKIKNIDAAGDKPYSVWCFDSMKRTIASRYPDDLKKNYRWLDENMIALSSSDDKRIKNKTTISGFPGIILGQEFDASIFGPNYYKKYVKRFMPLNIESGNSSSFLMIFAVPKESKDLKLSILGAAPVSVRISSDII